jgi:hypothetical protein
VPRGSHSIEIEASCDAVFDLVHDYGRRLDWDSMLSRAILIDATDPAVGVRSLCVGTWRSAFLPFETEYVRFEPGRIAAVKLTNRPMFFEAFAATIRHEVIGEGRSRIAYIYSFRSRPKFLAVLLEPVLSFMLSREVRRRLHCLRTFLEQNRDLNEPGSRGDRQPLPASPIGAATDRRRH